MYVRNKEQCTAYRYFVCVFLTLFVLVPVLSSSFCHFFQPSIYMFRAFAQVTTKDSVAGPLTLPIADFDLDTFLSFSNGIGSNNPTYDEYEEEPYNAHDKIGAHGIEEPYDTHGDDTEIPTVSKRDHYYK